MDADLDAPRCSKCDEPILSSSHVCEKVSDAARLAAQRRSSDDLYTTARAPSWYERLSAGFEMMANKEDGQDNADE